MNDIWRGKIMKRERERTEKKKSWRGRKGRQCRGGKEERAIKRMGRRGKEKRQ